MKILNLISSSGYYGAEKVLVELSKAASAAPGISHTYAGIIRNSSNPHTEICGALAGSGVTCVVFDCAGRFDLSTVRKIRKFVRDNGIGIVHSHGYKSNLFALAATLFLKVKRVTTVHNWILTDAKSRLYKLIDTLTLKFFDRIAVVSAQLLEELSRLGIRSDKVSFIGNGVGIERRRSDTAALRESLGIAPAARIVGTVGRLSGEKGHRYLILAAMEVLKEYPSTIFLFVGDGPLKEQYVAEIKNAGRSANFIFTGSRTDVHALLSMMDVFVLPSLTEGMPMALLEAMAARTPVIATRVGSVPSILQDPSAGLLVEPGDAAALTKKICMLLRDSELSRTIAKDAYYKVVKSYSANVMFGRYARMYSY